MGNIEEAPAQILCFITLRPEFGPNFEPLHCRAIVRSFEAPSKSLRCSSIVLQGKFADHLYHYDCQMICGTLAVVPNIQPEGGEQPTTHFFVIRNRTCWLQLFHKEIDRLIANSSWNFLTGLTFD